MKNKFLILVLVLGGLSFAEALPTESVLTTDIASKIANNALKQCRADGYNVSVSVINNSGIILTTLRDQNAGPHTVKGSYKKAYTAVSTKTPTSALAQKISENPSLSQMGALSKNFVFLAGGLPIKSGNMIIGAVGVSGAPSGDFDEKCAQIGIKSVEKDLK